MNKKALMEKRNAKKAELTKMLEVAKTEVRGLTSEEDATFIATENEIKELDSAIAKIEAEEKRAKDEAIKVEEIKIKEERGIEGMDKDKELRGLAQYIRKIDGEELRGMTTGSNGEVIPTHLYDDVIKILDECAPLFSRVPKLTPVNGVLEILKEKEIGNAAWVGEDEVLTASTFKMEKVKLEQKRCGSVVELTQHLINDAGIDIVSYARSILSTRLAKALDRAMVTGNKTTQFEGLTNAKTNVVTTGTTESIAIEDFMNMINAMHPSLQADSVWVMSRKLFNEVALLQDAIGNFYMLRDVSLVDGKPVYKLFGQPVLINDAVATETTTDTQVCYLVNFERAYAGMIKKQIEFSNISDDTQNRLKASSTLVMDIFADAKIVDENAIVVLKRK